MTVCSMAVFSAGAAEEELPTVVSVKVDLAGWPGMYGGTVAVVYAYDADGNDIFSMVDGKSIGAVASYKFVKVQTAHTIEARFATAPMKDPDTGFSDIAKSDYFYDAVKWAVGSKVTSGLTETTFGPQETCTRAQTVTFLWRAAGSPQTNSVDNPFTDVKRSDYYYQAVLWAVANNVTNGVSATSFDPNVTVQRDQVVTFLWRASGKPAAKADLAFSDLADGAFYADAVQWAVAHGITTGTSSTTFAPADGCTRAQIVTFLYRSKN